MELEAEKLIDLPLDIRIYISHLDFEIYMRLYYYDAEFRKYANKDTFFNNKATIIKGERSIYYKVNNITYNNHDDGFAYWSINDKTHKLDGPAIIYSNGTKIYYQYGKIHNLYGPAMIHSEGIVKYYVNGKKHRENGPAIIGLKGYYEYWLDDKLHRLDGPAVEYADRTKEYWRYGRRVYL